ncbi:MAG: hypothetical protein ABIJ34_07380 [archaeon]
MIYRFESDSRENAPGMLERLLSLLRDHEIDSIDSSRQTYLQYIAYLDAFGLNFNTLSVKSLDQSHTSICEIPSVGTFELSGESYDLFHRFKKTLNGDELEIDTSHEFERPLESRRYWSGWKKGGHALRYRQLYGWVCNAVLPILGEFKDLDKIIIADIFAGDGEFIEVLVRAIAQATQIRNVEFHVVDNNRAALTIARSRSDSVHSYLPEASYFVHNSNCVRNPLPFRQNPHIVTAMGALTQEVCSRKNAENSAFDVSSHQDKSSFFIAAAGAAEIQLSRAYFESIGYGMHNMSIPALVKMGMKPDQLYIMQK